MQSGHYKTFLCTFLLLVTDLHTDPGIGGTISAVTVSKRFKIHLFQLVNTWLI